MNLEKLSIFELRKLEFKVANEICKKTNALFNRGDIVEVIKEGTRFSVGTRLTFEFISGLYLTFFDEFDNSIDLLPEQYRKYLKKL